MPGIDPWAQFGLAGAVIGALFLVLWKIVKYGTDKYDVLDKRHTESIEKMVAGHRDERKEWRDHSEQSTARLEAAFKDVTNRLER